MAPRSLFKNYGDGTRQRARGPDLEVMEESAAAHLHEMEKNSVYFEENLPRSVPRLDTSEILLEHIIGMGEFGTVMEVSQIQRKRSIVHHRCDCPAPLGDCVEQEEIQSPSSEAMPRVSYSCLELSLLDELELPENDVVGCQCTETDFQHQNELISRISSTVSNNNANGKLRYNYAVKHIRKDLYPAKRAEAAKSLAREQKFLQTIHHPNIIRLRGIVGRPGFDTHMIILDKLEHSLLQQIFDWKEQVKPTSFSLWKSQKSSEKDVLSKRLLALYDIARAIEFLHSKCILFRDLKTENVARNSRTGAMQLFDFGLAKELKATNKSDNGQYHLTGLTGTLRIMSPEVIQCMPYGFSADLRTRDLRKQPEKNPQNTTRTERQTNHNEQKLVGSRWLWVQEVGEPNWFVQPSLRSGRGLGLQYSLERYGCSAPDISISSLKCKLWCAEDVRKN
eukprot:scaffold5281_cov127-Cylindrotheca_fusiformis.AAC.5